MTSCKKLLNQAFNIKPVNMGKEKKPGIPTEVPEPEQKPEVEQPVHPDDPGAPNVKPEIIPEEEPELVPEEKPGEPELPKSDQGN